MDTSVVIIPTFNEKENVEKMIRTILGYEHNFHILIIDDASPDGTASIVKKIQNEYPTQLYIEERKGKLGLGTAYIHGFKWAMAHNYTYIFEMDCDFSHNPEDLIRLKNALTEQKAHLSIGSRYCKGGETENWPIGRILMSYFASVYVRMVLFISIKDTTAGFKCYHKDVLQKIDIDSIPFKGYAFQICMKYAAIKHGFKLVEIPITFIDRELGTSKMNSSIFKEAFFGVWKMRKMKL
jgi:dolichol-phosphate mannosyltransferase